MLQQEAERLRLDRLSGALKIIDWQGVSMGAQIPGWAAVATSDEEALKRLDSVGSEPTYKGMAIAVASASGQDIDLLKT